MLQIRALPGGLKNPLREDFLSPWLNYFHFNNRQDMENLHMQFVCKDMQPEEMSTFYERKTLITTQVSKTFKVEQNRIS